MGGLTCVYCFYQFCFLPENRSWRTDISGAAGVQCLIQGVCKQAERFAGLVCAVFVQGVASHGHQGVLQPFCANFAQPSSCCRANTRRVFDNMNIVSVSATLFDSVSSGIF